MRSFREQLCSTCVDGKYAVPILNLTGEHRSRAVDTGVTDTASSPPNAAATSWTTAPGQSDRRDLRQHNHLSIALIKLIDSTVNAADGPSKLPERRYRNH